LNLSFIWLVEMEENNCISNCSSCSVNKNSLHPTALLKLISICTEFHNRPVKTMKGLHICTIRWSLCKPLSSPWKKYPVSIYLPLIPKSFIFFWIKSCSTEMAAHGELVMENDQEIKKIWYSLIFNVHINIHLSK
jgi:hypothetical protein